jgi:acyl-CoA thioester hydrolase
VPRTPVTVEARSYELDPYGHLNNAVFVNWLEHGRSAFLRERGSDWSSLPGEFGVRVVVVRQDVSYRGEVRLHDRLVITSGIDRWGSSSFVFSQEIAFEDGRLAAVAEVTMVAVGDAGAVPVPEALRERLSE